MIFYHFTTRDALIAILEEGLMLGEAPLGPRRVVNAVNLTTDADPSGHGLDCGGQVITELEAARFARLGFVVPAGTIYADKRQVRITVKLPSSDPKLKRWRPWSRKHCEPGFAEILERSAGATPSKAKSWWLYFGVIPPSRFVRIDVGDEITNGESEHYLADISISTDGTIAISPVD